MVGRGSGDLPTWFNSVRRNWWKAVRALILALITTAITYVWTFVSSLDPALLFLITAIAPMGLAVAVDAVHKVTRRLRRDRQSKTPHSWPEPIADSMVIGQRQDGGAVLRAGSRAVDLDAPAFEYFQGLDGNEKRRIQNRLAIEKREAYRARDLANIVHSRAEETVSLVPRFDQRSPYRFERNQVLEYRLGIFNDSPSMARNVELWLRQIVEPGPLNPQYRADYPYRLRRLDGPVGPCDINPHSEELFTIISTWTSGDGRVIVSGLDTRRPDFSMAMQQQERWSLDIEAVSANSQPRMIRIGMRIVAGTVLVVLDESPRFFKE